jgi:hypothetical protein
MANGKPTPKRKRAAAPGQEPRSAARVRKHRAKMRRAGMRLMQMWVPDTSDPAVVAEIRRQCLLVRDHPEEERILAEIEAVADLDGWK